MSSPSPNDLTRQQLDELDALLQRMLSLPLSPPPTAATGPPVVPQPPIPYAPRPPATPPVVTPPVGWRFDVPASPKPLVRLPMAEEDLPELAAAVAPLAAEPLAAARPGYSAPAPSAPVSLAADLPLPPTAPARLFGPPTPDTGVSPPTVGTLRGVDAPALPAGFRPTIVPEPPPLPPEEEFAELTPAAEPPPEPPAAASPGVPIPLWPLFAANWILEAVLGLFGPLGTALTWGPTKHLLGWSGLALLAGAGAWAARGMGWIKW